MDKFKPLYQEQPLLFGMTRENYLSYLSTQISSDALCRLVKEVVMHLDTSIIESKYSARGQKSYHPKLLLSLLFYGYAIGGRSSRQLEEKCQRDMHFFFLMESRTPMSPDQDIANDIPYVPYLSTGNGLEADRYQGNDHCEGK